MKTLVLSHFVPAENPPVSDEQWLAAARHDVRRKDRGGKRFDGVVSAETCRRPARASELTRHEGRLYAGLRELVSWQLRQLSQLSLEREPSTKPDLRFGRRSCR